MNVSPRRRQLWQARRGLCHYCGIATKLRAESQSDPLLATLDHVIPESKGGTSALTNLVLACYRCNNEKGDRVEWTPGEKRPGLPIAKPFEPAPPPPVPHRRRWFPVRPLYFNVARLNRARVTL
jgi:5-methylcytosine-specific restriction endonuclease McrA